MTTREIAKSVIDVLPEDASMEDIIAALYIRAKLERAEQSIEQGKGVSHADAKKRLQKWLK
jgi:hypothetical protein